MRLIQSCLGLFTTVSILTPCCLASDRVDDLSTKMFISKVQKAVKHNWFPPNPGFDLAVTIEVETTYDGRIISSHILKSSGNRRADAAAMHAVSSAFPIKPEARYLNIPRKTLALIIAFDWKKTGGVSVTKSNVSH